jgi:hypothetical protein
MTGKLFDGIKDALREKVSPNARLNTDARIYRKIAQSFALHMVVNHSAGEYVMASQSISFDLSIDTTLVESAASPARRYG